MLTGHINGATRVLGAPAGCEDSVSPLAIRDVLVDGNAVMVSAWMPTPEEALAISAGAPIYLQIFGTQHPVVAMSVGDNSL